MFVEILNASRYYSAAELRSLPLPTEEDLTLSEAAAESGLSVETLRAQIRNGRLPATKKGRDWIVTGRALVACAEDVVLEGPTWPTLTGRQTVLGFLRMILPGIRSARVEQHIVDGDHVATIFDMDTAQGVDRVCDCIEIANGEITRVRAFFFPRQPATH